MLGTSEMVVMGDSDDTDRCDRWPWSRLDMLIGHEDTPGIMAQMRPLRSISIHPADTKLPDIPGAQGSMGGHQASHARTPNQHDN